MKMKKIKIGKKVVGSGHPCFVVGEIGINHNGSIDMTKKLIDAAIFAGCDAVKFQKRTVDVVFTKEELEKPRESPFGNTNGDLKRGLEFGKKEFDKINKYCKEKRIPWFASCWDERSVDFIEQYNPPCYKIASPCLTDDALLNHHVATGKPVILSTGMSTIAQIDHALDILGKERVILLHCTSTYPSMPDELNLTVIQQFASRYQLPIGYSGHEVGLYTTLAAVVLGACMIERHITLDRAMWGSDQAASVEPYGMRRLVKDIRFVERAMGDGAKRVYDSELPIMKKLRRVE